MCRRSCRALIKRSAQDRHAYDQQTGKSRRITRFVRCRCLKEIGDSVCAGALAEPSSRGLPKTGMRTTNKSERVDAVAQFVRCRCLKEISDSACAGALAELSSEGLPKIGMRTTNKSERVDAVARFVPLSLLEGNQRLRVCRRSCRALLKRSAQDRHAYDQQIGKSRSIARFVRCRCLKEISDSARAGALAEPSSRGLPKTGMRTTNKPERVGAVARFVRCRCLKEISDSANSARFRASSLLAKTIVADVLPQCACK